MTLFILIQYKPPLPGAKKRQIAPPKAGPALRTGRAGSGSSTGQLESQYSNMSIKEKAGRGRGTGRRKSQAMSEMAILATAKARSVRLLVLKNR